MAAEARSPRIFVSYARSDGKELARDLGRRLSEDHGFSLWQDLADMEGGQDWWRQITEAIDHVEYLVLVMTAASLRSPVVRNEWRYARQRGVCVVPVKGASELDFSQLAGWMRRAHFVDPTVPEQWTRMVRTLESPCRVPRVPMMAEPPPADFVPRRELEALRSQLLDASRQEPVAITAALRGAGGYGKTTLARALCHDDDVQDAFHDGVLWVTLGEQPGDLSARVEEWIVVLSGEASKLSSLEGRKSRLTELLADRSLLLVVDDVWNAAHLKPFLVEGPRCARLITTRNSDTLPRGAREVPVDAMQPGEALALIRSGLPEGEDASLTSLARRLGEWPVLLRLVNGALHNRVVRHRATLGGSLDYVTRILDRRGLTGFDARDQEQQRAGFDARDPEQRAQAVAWTIDVSLEQLSEQERGRFRELAVFPEDVDVPIATVERLWRRTGGLDDIETEDLLQRLFGLSLLLNYDLATRHIRVHDVIRAYLRGQIGDGLVQLDGELAEAYRTGCPAGWASGRNDGYLFQYLLWHLAGAGQHAEVRSLLLDPAWIEAKLRATNVGALLEDYKGFARDQTTRVMGQALRLSAPALARDPGAFLSQLLGRIDQSAEMEIGAALRRAEEAPSGNAWLRPRTRSLTPPGGPLLQTIEGHTDRVAAVAVTPDGARAVSGSWDGTLRVWELSTGRALATLEGHTDQVAAVAVTPDGARAVSGSNDGTLKVWELSTGHALATLEGPWLTITAVAVTPDGARAVSGSWDGTLRVWELSTGRALATLEGHTDQVAAVAVTPDGARAVSGSNDGTLKVWELSTGHALATLEGHTHQVTAVAVTPDGARAVSGSNDGTLKVWELSTGHALATLEGPWLTITAVAVTPDGAQAVSGSGGMLKLWELSTGRVLATLEGHTDQVSAVAVTPDGTRAVSGSHDRTLRVWELSTGHVLATLEGHTDQVSAVAVTPDGARAVSGSWDGTLRVWELSTGRALATFEGHALVGAVAVTPDGARAVSGSWDGTLRVWELSTGRALATREGHTDRVVAVAVTPDGTRAVSGSADRTLRVWELRTGHALATLEGHTDQVTAVAVMPDGARAVSGSWDRTLRVWELSTGRVLATLEGHTGQVSAVAVTPDGTRAVSGSHDRTLRVWDLETEEVIASFHADSAVAAVACAGDTDFVAGCSDGAMHFLELRA